MNRINIYLIVQFLCFSSFAQDQEMGSIEVISQELASIIKKDAKIEVIVDGCQFTEGPLWVEQNKMLLFSDVPANTIYKWTATGGKKIYLQPAGYTGSVSRGGFIGSNGLYLTNDNKLWICQHGDRRIAELNAPLDAPKPEFETIVDKYDGKKLNSPNDLVIAKNGDLYFTDPAYGLMNDSNGPVNKELSFQGVYKMDKSGKVTLLVDSLSTPNGIGISPDGKTLLVAETQGPKRGWYAYDIKPDGTLENGRDFYDPGDDSAIGGCDGFKFDKKGNVFASGPGGIWIFTRKGKLIGKVKVNNLTAANCALSPDDKTLYITATQYILRVKMR